MELLNVGDKIERYEFNKPSGHIYEIISVTKTLAKSENLIFKREVESNGYVSLKKDIGGLKTKYYKVG